jgi:hypothetical protein
MAKFAAKDSNKNITLSPHGTGKVVVGTGAADATVQSDGNHNLVLQTGNSTTGSISITDGSNGNIAITPNGTGEVDISKVDIDAGAIDGVTIGTNSAVTDLRVDNIKVDGNTISSTNTDGDISISPNGTGELVVGSGSASGKITSSGAHDLVIDTNSGTNSGSITITDGTDGNINITPNGNGRTVLGGTTQLTQINDTNDNALVKVTATTNAVNEITIGNAATSGVPSITGSGDDSSVSLLLDCKGNGEVVFGANTNFTSKTDAKLQLPSAGGVYESDGSTEILTESSGTVTLKNTTLDSTVNVPDGMVTNFIHRQFAFDTNGSFANQSGGSSQERIAMRGSDGSAVVPSFTAKQGYTYQIVFHYSAYNDQNGSINSSGRMGTHALYYGTTSRSSNDATFDTKLFAAQVGSQLTTDSTSQMPRYQAMVLRGAFYQSASDATTYVYFTTDPQSNGKRVVNIHSTAQPTHLFITEYKGNLSTILT